MKTVKHDVNTRDATLKQVKFVQETSYLQQI